MKKVWLNDRQPDENGDYVLEIVNGNGHRISTFKGKTIEEVADLLADAQVNANRQLSRTKPDSGRQPFQAVPRELTPADRLRLSSEITDPNRVAEAVTEIVTAAQGVPPAQVAKKLEGFDQEAADEYYRQEAVAFTEDYPEYYPVPENQSALFESLRANNYDLTRNNLAIVFNQLFHAGKLVPWPSDDALAGEPEPAPVPVAPPAAAAPRPRSFSSGLRNTDANASKPAPKPRTPVITRAELERMSRAEYNERLRDPRFRTAVDALA